MAQGFYDSNNPVVIDTGTLCINRSLPSNPQCGSSGNLVDLESALGLLKTEALNFGTRFITDGKVRSAYIRQTEDVARIIKEEVLSGQISYSEGAKEANRLRNSILETARLNSSDIGRAQAEALKATGKSLQELESYYAAKLFKKAFEELSQAEKNQVWLEVVMASGRSRPSVNVKALRLAKAAKGLIIVSVAIAVYNVTTSDNKGRQVVKEGVTTGSSILGGIAGGAAAGLACGPGAPVCVTIGVFVGGVAAALGADYIFEKLW